jgi:hypothetical protein
MKKGQVEFRDYYKHFIAVPMNEDLRVVIEDFPGADHADYMLTYGYIDHFEGLMLEVVASAFKNEDTFYFSDTNLDVGVKIPIKMVDQSYSIDDADGRLYERYAEKLDPLKEEYYFDLEGKENILSKEDLEAMREMDIIDPFRSIENPDVVMVFLVKDGNSPEPCSVRMERFLDDNIIGILLEEPEQDFGYHLGDKIAFFIQRIDDEDVFLLSDMNPSKKITLEDLEDGTMLEKAIHIFNEEPNENNLVEILEILRDSFVWIPCNAIIEDNDLENMLSANIGDTIQIEDDLRMVPDILQEGDKLFFPVFSNMEAMGEYGNYFSKIGKHFIEVIHFAMNYEKDLSGIVINAFSEPFELDKEIWDIVLKMKSRLQ